MSWLSVQVRHNSSIAVVQSAWERAMRDMGYVPDSSISLAGARGAPDISGWAASRREPWAEGPAQITATFTGRGGRVIVTHTVEVTPRGAGHEADAEELISHELARAPRMVVPYVEQQIDECLQPAYLSRFQWLKLGSDSTARLLTFAAGGIVYEREALGDGGQWTGTWCFVDDPDGQLLRLQFGDYRMDFSPNRAPLPWLGREWAGERSDVYAEMTLVPIVPGRATVPTQGMWIKVGSDGTQSVVRCRDDGLTEEWLPDALHEFVGGHRYWSGRWSWQEERLRMDIGGYTIVVDLDDSGLHRGWSEYEGCHHANYCYVHVPGGVK